MSSNAKRALSRVYLGSSVPLSNLLQGIIFLVSRHVKAKLKSVKKGKSAPS